MHSLLAALNRGEGFMPSSARKSAGFNVSGEFAAFFNRSLAGTGSAAQDLLSRLRERFPEAKIAERDVAPGLEESKKAAGDDGDTKSDKVNLSGRLLEEMGLDAGLADKIEAVLAGLFGNAAAATPPGSYVQRSVTLTVTTVRYTEMLRTDAEGSVLAAAEMQTALREKIDEMLTALSDALEGAFGGTGKTDGKEGEDGAAGTKAGEGGGSSAEKTIPARKQFSSAFASLWSVELFYSTAAVQGSTRSGAGGESAWGNAGVEAAWGGAYFSAGSFSGGSYSRASLSGGYGAWGGLTGGGLPSFLAQMLEGGGGRTAGGDVSGFLGDALAGSGVSLSGYRQIETGFSLKFAASRNLIEELMELYGDRLGGGRERADAGAGAADTAAGTEAEVVTDAEAVTEDEPALAV